MTVVKHELKGEVRIIVIDAVQLLDGPAIDQCTREILDVLDKTEESHVLVHFGRVTFLASAALGMLIRVNKKCKQHDIALKLCGINPTIRQVFKITNLDKVFEIHEDTAEAMAAFKASGKMFFRKGPAQK